MTSIYKQQNFLLFSAVIFKNLKETNKIEVKKNFKKIYKNNHALEKLGSPQIHKKSFVIPKKKSFMAAVGLEPTDL